MFQIVKPFIRPMQILQGLIDIYKRNSEYTTGSIVDTHIIIAVVHTNLANNSQ